MTHAYPSAPTGDRRFWQLPLLIEGDGASSSEWAIEDVLHLLDANAAQLEAELFAFMRARLGTSGDDDKFDSFGVDLGFRREVSQGEQAITTLRELRCEVAAIARRFGVVT